MRTTALKTTPLLCLCLCLFSASFLFNACSKKTDTSCPASFKVTANTLTPTVGSTLTLTAAPEKFNYDWNGPRNFHEMQTSGLNSISIDNIQINQSGWWHGSLLGTGCGILNDSVYIDVKYKQGTPSCSLTDNLVTGTGVPDLQASSVRKTFDLTWNCMSLYASGSYGYPSYTVLFNSYNGHAEPKDGLYVTNDIQSFDPLQDANVVCVICQYSSYYFKTQPGQTIYISHVGGKLRAAFCGLKMTGDNGNSVMITQTFSGEFTEK